MAENNKYKSDIEIAREAKLENIVEISEKKLNISEKFLEQYGHHKAKISFDYIVNYANETGRNLDGFEWAHYTFISLYETREKSAEMAAKLVGGSFRTGGNLAEIIGKYTVLGPVESAIERIQEYTDAGANHFMFNWMCDPTDAHDQMKLAAEKILPHFS